MSTDLDHRALKDGTRIYIRPISPEDQEALAAGFDRLSPESRYRRFFTPLEHLSEQQLDYLTQVDHHDHEALVAIEESTGEGIGVARFVRVADDVAEPAIVVADEWQRRGVAGHLLDALADRAREEGVRRFVAPVLAQNTAAIEAFERLGEVTLAPQGIESELTVDLTEPADAGSRLRELLRAIASGAVAPALGLWELLTRPRQPQRGFASAIMVAVHDSGSGAYAADCAAELASAFGIVVHLVAAYRPILDDRSALERVLHDAERRLQDRDVQVTSRLLAGDPALSILYAATGEQAGLIVVESPPSIPGASDGSAVWKAVARHAGCDVLIARRPGRVRRPTVAPEPRQRSAHRDARRT
jgi:RimJ/RimL family protein N-acetyltransferase/nucleotide-binding universal stress UspA family protein